MAFDAHGYTLPPVKGLGTSWYERGAGYRARRTGLTIGLAAVAAIMVYLDFGVVTGIASLYTSWVHYLVLGVGIAIFIGSLVWAYRQFNDVPEEKEAGCPRILYNPRARPLKPGTTKRMMRGATLMGPMAVAGSAAGLVAIVGAVFFAGLPIMMAAFSMQRYVSRAEFLAVQRYGTRDHPRDLVTHG
ncbi:hypothetical protein GCM10027169_09110 [Gordonia jinhuaensis]|uniref:Uncharacterized protein n=2 Tax=Gordonia jinhuaensis TaxID=1517702 RepID=A0A916THR4_9ACTN|nr:hypothetical protein GCM10011489_36800 [Gordonia jinhuaensis]